MKLIIRGLDMALLYNIKHLKRVHPNETGTYIAIKRYKDGPSEYKKKIE